MEKNRSLAFSASFNEKLYKTTKQQRNTELRKKKRIDDAFSKRNIKSESTMDFFKDPSQVLELIQSESCEEIAQGLGYLEKLLNDQDPGKDYISIAIDKIILLFHIYIIPQCTNILKCKNINNG